MGHLKGKFSKSFILWGIFFLLLLQWPTAKVEHTEKSPRKEAKYNEVTCFGHGESYYTEWQEDVPVDKYKFSN